MRCPIDPEHHDCVAMDFYMAWPNDYPESPCVGCNQKRINELNNKIKNRDKDLEQCDRVNEYMTSEECRSLANKICEALFKCQIPLMEGENGCQGWPL